MRSARTIKELSDIQRLRLVLKNKKTRNLMGTRRMMSISEWLDSLGIPKFRVCSHPLNENYGVGPIDRLEVPHFPVNSQDHWDIKLWAGVSPKREEPNFKIFKDE